MRFIHRRSMLWAVLFVSMGLFAGCYKVGPDYVRPKTAVAHNWLEMNDGRVSSQAPEYRAWWEVFQDPVLNRIIETAYRENLSLKQAGVRVLEARARLGIAVGNLYPQTQQASGALTYNRTSERSFFAAAGQARNSQTGTSGDNDDKYRQSTGQTGMQFSYWQDQVGINAAWEIDLWGRFRRAVESAEASHLAAIADYDSVLVSLTADAANAYIQIRTLEKRLDIVRQNVETEKASLEIAEARFKGGVTSERDVEQARTILFNTQSTIPTLNAQLTQAKNALCVLLGMPPDNLENVLKGSSDIPAPPPQVAVGIPADLLRRRPDVRSAELQAAAQSAQIGVAKADLFPAFSLTGSFGFLSTDINGFSLSDIGSWDARNGSFGPSFQWNILNYGRITNNVRVQDARFQELLIAYQNAVLTAQKEVEDSLAGFLRAQENAEYLSLSTGAARKSLNLAFIQYQEGITDFTTVLSAQQSLLVSQDSLAVALGNISANLVGIYRALGGGWQTWEGREMISPEIKEAMAKRTNWGKMLSPAVYMPSSGGSESTIRFPDW